MASTYYIDFKNGNDTTGNGSTGTPWKTLAKALTVAGNSDTVYARGSSADNTTWFREHDHTISQTGFTLAADTGHSPVFTGTHEYTSWSKTGGQTNVYEAAYTPSVCYKVWNGTTILSSAADVASCDAASNSYYADLVGDKLYVNIGGGAPSSLEAYDVAIDYICTISGAGSSVIGISYYYQLMALRLTGGSNNVTSCTFRYSGGFSTNAVYGFLLSDSSANVVSDCVFEYGVTTKTVQVGTGSSSSSLTVTQCTFSTGYKGIYLAYGTNNVISYCTLSSMGQDGVGCTGATTGVISYCQASDCVHACYIPGTPGSTVDWVVHHCIAYCTGGTMSFGYCLDGGSVTYYHCVVDGATTRGFFAISNDRVSAENNIAINCAQGYVIATGYSPTGSRDYNCVYNSGTDDYALAWSQGAHDVVANPLCIDAPGRDYALAKGSPCTDTGIVVAGINDGYKGVAPDIGRYESDYGGSGLLLLGVG